MASIRLGLGLLDSLIALVTAQSECSQSKKIALPSCHPVSNNTPPAPIATTAPAPACVVAHASVVAG